MLSQSVRAFLEERRFAVLATIADDGMPQQTVMWYDVDGDEILMNTALGRFKAANLQRDPRASICIEDGYRYVTIAGAVQLNDDPEVAQADIARLARRYEAPERAEGMIANFRKQPRLTIRLNIDNLITNGFDQ